MPDCVPSGHEKKPALFLRIRRAQIGHHHHVAGPYVLRFAQEASLRWDNRRLSNGEQVDRVAGLAMASRPRIDFTGGMSGPLNKSNWTLPSNASGGGRRPNPINLMGI
jgi:hypothetical protein